MLKNKRIAIIGTRGVPARYGGFETFAEEFGVKLKDEVKEVIVYGRSYGFNGRLKVKDQYRGLTSVRLPAIKHKYLETPLHSLFSFLDLIFNRVDAVILCNGANSPFAFVPKILGIPLIINVDGIEKERRKWNILGKVWYTLGEAASCLFANLVVTDAEYIRDYYLSKYATDSVVIRYGAKLLDQRVAQSKIDGDYSFLSAEEVGLLSSYGIKAGEYLLYVSRLEPENNADKVILAYSEIPKNLREKYPLVIVGDAPYAASYKKYLSKIAPVEVKFLGYRFEKEYEALQKGAFLYLQATEVGGTHPALVEAMGFANLIIANDVPEHRETTSDTCIYYPYNSIIDLRNAFLEILNEPREIKNYRESAYNRAKNHYSWGAITERYCSILDQLLTTK